MSGLTDLVTQSSDKTTTLPSWYTSAQQDAVNKATAGVNAMPALKDTTIGGAINTLTGPNNPFSQGQSTLNTIATGAANPWLVSSTGAVTPNTNTALGGLFAAQTDQMKKLLPQYEAPATAGAIAGGNFGSLRGMTAADTAVTNALADLQTKQMQAALSNQQTGVNAATGLGNIGAQETTAQENIGKLQQAEPTQQAAALASLLSNIKVPESVNQTTSASPLDKINQLITAYKGLPTEITGPLTNVFGKMVGTTGSILNTVLGGVGSDPISQAGGIMNYSPGIDQFSSVWGS